MEKIIQIEMEIATEIENNDGANILDSDFDNDFEKNISEPIRLKLL